MCSDLSLDNIQQHHPKEAASSMISYLSGGMENAVNEGANMILLPEYFNSLPIVSFYEKYAEDFAA